MDTLSKYQELILKVINDHISFAGKNPTFQFVPIIDSMNDRYALMMQGWQGRKWIHICVIHLEIIDGKVWVLHDGTDYGVANELAQAGVPKDQIVLGFKSPELRPYTEFAAA